MKIVADSQIPLVQQAFSNIGDVLLYEDRKLTPQLISDADVLVVRSVSKVDAELLENSHVSFVATATSGIDHVDTEYLQQKNIGFASAHGSNALSVVEYVLSCMSILAEQNNFDLFKKTVGIIGCGKVGSRLKSVLDTIGVNCVVNDPPLKDKTGDSIYVDLQEIINSDIITLHVPLTSRGLYPTRNLVNENFLARMKKDAILINTSRGKVVDEMALKKYIDHHENLSAVIDVWENEPDIDPGMLQRADIGTPHIAGYSIDAKIKATEMIYSEACRFFDIQPEWKPVNVLIDAGKQKIRIDSSLADQEAIQMAVLSHYDVRSDAASLRRALEIEESKVGYYFDQLRKNYPVRRNFQATTINLSEGRNGLAEKLEKLGFNISWHQI